MLNLIEVSTTEEIPAGKMKAASVGGGEDILLVNYEGEYYAIGRFCTHQGGDLSKGKLERKIVDSDVPEAWL